MHECIVPHLRILFFVSCINVWIWIHVRVTAALQNTGRLLQINNSNAVACLQALLYHQCAKLARALLVLLAVCQSFKFVFAIYGYIYRYLPTTHSRVVQQTDPT